MTQIDGEVIGYRQWRVSDDLELCPAGWYLQPSWAIGVNKAICLKRQDKELFFGDDDGPRCEHAPGEDCHCGIYGLHSPNDPWYGPDGRSSRNFLTQRADEPYVSGIISAWGEVEVHHEGFRAEYARIVALATPDTKLNAAIARAAADVYGVPAVPIKELPRIAAEFGGVIAEELRPAKQPKPKPSSLAQALKQSWASSVISGYQATTNNYFWNVTSGSVPVAPKALLPVSEKLRELERKKAEQNYNWYRQQTKQNWKRGYR